jgi:hypothetical protein
MDSQQDTLGTHAGPHTYQLGLTAGYRVPRRQDILYNYFAAGKDDKAVLFIPSDTGL